jgi:hypothetical protein
MSASAAHLTEWLTPSDWKPLVANGFATATKDGKQTIYKLSYDPIMDAMASELITAADVDTVDQFKSNALTESDFVFDLIGLTRDERTCPAGVDERDWLDPRIGMVRWVRSKLGTQFDRPVQKKVLEKGKILVSGNKKIAFTTEGGHTLAQHPMGYAVTDKAEVLKAYQVDPMVESMLRQDLRRIKHNSAMINAAPDTAGVLIASLDVLATSAASRRQAVYVQAIEGMSSEQVAELDSKIADAVSVAQTENAAGLSALTDGSDK